MIPLDAVGVVGVDRTSRTCIDMTKASKWDGTSPLKATYSLSPSPTTMKTSADGAESPRRSERLRRITPYVGWIGTARKTWCRRRTAYLTFKDGIRKSRHAGDLWKTDMNQRNADSALSGKESPTCDGDAVVPVISEIKRVSVKLENEVKLFSAGDENHQHQQHQQQQHQQQQQQQVLHLTSDTTASTTSPLSSIPLPEDPRQWTRDEVHKWLRNCQLRYRLPEDIILDRFMMNGKALCIMRLDMFMNRVPIGGDVLHSEFQTRLHRVLSKNNNIIQL